jgi:diguanylate cyclase (GGDEF) domain
MLFSRPYRLARLGRGDRIVMRVCLALLLAVLSLPAAAIHCEGADHVRLKHPVELAPALRAEIRALAPLKILALDSPPIAKYNAEQRRYQGIAIDILCFLSEELGMKFEIAPHDESLSVAEQVRYVQEGKADVFLPISYSSSRAERGVFTADFYSSYYAVIARRGANVVVRSFNDLANYQVGYVNGFSLESMLRAQVPADQLSSYSQWTSNGLFDALQDGRIDVALFSQQVFTEKRYASELFDLEIIHVLYDFPRAYRFYFSPSSEHERLVAAIDMYLSAMDLSASFKAHQEGERSLVERYVAQRNQSTVLRTASVAAAALALIAFLAMLRHRRLTRLLKEQNAYIEHQRHALVEANKKLEILSQTDPLTELPNRRSFDERAVREYTRYLNTDTPLSVLIIDVDHFKSVNDDFWSRNRRPLFAHDSACHRQAGKSGSQHGSPLRRRRIYLPVAGHGECRSQRPCGTDSARGRTTASARSRRGVRFNYRQHWCSNRRGRRSRNPDAPDESGRSTLYRQDQRSKPGAILHPSDLKLRASRYARCGRGTVQTFGQFLDSAWRDQTRPRIFLR